jgi:hypothetical protein
MFLRSQDLCLILEPPKKEFELILRKIVKENPESFDIGKVRKEPKS